jgi:signal transduction histidine kinase
LSELNKDISELHESLLSSVMSNSTESIAVSAVEGPDKYRLLYLNNTNLKHINKLCKANYTANDLVGKLHEDLFLNFYKATREEFEDDNKKRRDSIQSKKRLYYDEAFKVDNETLFLESCVTPIFNEYGICTHTLWSARDITERKIIEEEKSILLNETLMLNEELKANEDELMQINRELIYQNEQLNQFSYIVSHNLRGPISTLLGLTNIFNSSSNTPEFKEELISHIQKSTGHLDTIIRDLNTILTQTKEVDHTSILVDIQSELSIIFDLYKPQIEKSEAVFHLDLSKAPTVFAIKSFINSILSNLVSNSLKYKKLNQAVVVKITSDIIDNNIVITHTDNGLGLDLKMHGDKIFGFYKRFHTHVEGKGMGLHLVKTQVEMMGGRIEVESEVNKGTTFTIVLKK